MPDERARPDRGRDRPRSGRAGQPGPVERLVASPWRGVGGAVLLLMVWVVGGTAGYMLIEGWGPLDAVYMTVITLTTVGFEEIHPLSTAGRVFTMFLVAVGLGTVLYGLTRIAQLVIEGELLDILGRRRMQRELDQLEDHFIVCGYGRTAKPVVEGLKEENVDFCVVEVDPDREHELREDALLYVLGDATEEEMLEAAGIARARGLLALLPSDADNLYLTMTAKGLNEVCKVIARATDERAEMKMRRVGAAEVVSPNKMAGLRVVQAAVRPTVVEFMELVSHREHIQLGLEEIQVGAGCGLDGVTLGDAELRRRSSVIIVAIKREDGEMVFNPRPADIIRFGDKLVALGEQDDLRTLEGICSSDGAPPTGEARGAQRG